MKQLDDLHTVIGVETLQDPYLLPAAEATGDMKAVGKELREHGVVTIKGAIPPAAVADFAAEHRRLLNMLEPELTSDQMIPRGKGFYKSYMVMPGGLQICANATGRFELRPLDRRDGGTEVKEKTRIAELVEPFISPPALAEVLDNAFDTPWRAQAVGSLPTDPNAPAGQWHRDVGTGLFDDEDMELRMPDYFFTALFPLEDTLTSENGSECVLGSHRKRIADLGSSPRVVTAGAPGDVTIMNGKIVHRGLANTSAPRPLLYVVYAAHWFEAGRDATREYWQTAGLKQ